jgi:acetyl-CoA carboxylase biotin carboxyl carrier protein
MTDDLTGSDPGDEALDDGPPPMAVGPGPDPSSIEDGTPRIDGDPALPDGGDLELLGLIDRLGALLDRSDLTELEVESGGTSLVLRKPSALAPPASTAQGVGIADPPPAAPAASEPAAASARPSVKAPLTGIFYASPAPGSAPYVAVGREVAVGQVIGLIEAMKLFNEIKSDLAGRVVRVVAESGTLVKAKQTLIEVEPL